MFKETPAKMFRCIPRGFSAKIFGTNPEGSLEKFMDSFEETPAGIAAFHFQKRFLQEFLFMFQNILKAIPTEVPGTVSGRFLQEFLDKS